jgi:hypothetical protein
MLHPEVLVLVLYNILLESDLESFVLSYRWGEVELDEEQDKAYEECREIGYTDCELEEEFVYRPNIGSIMDSITQERLLTYAEIVYRTILDGVVKKYVGCKKHRPYADDYLPNKRHEGCSLVISRVLLTI